MNSVVKIGLLVIVLGMICAPVMAEGAATKPAATQPAGGSEASQVESVEKFSAGRGIAIVGACFGAGLCAIGGGYAIARTDRQRRRRGDCQFVARTRKARKPGHRSVHTPN